MKDIRYSVKSKKFRRYFLTGSGSLSFFNNIFGAGSIFMTSFLLYLNARPSDIGLMAALPNLTALLQIFSYLIYKKFQSRKKVIIFLKIMEYAFFYMLIIIPKAVSGRYQMVLVMVCFFVGFVFRSLAGGGVVEWNNKFVPPEIKGKYFSNTNLLANAAYIVISLTVGKILDIHDRNYTAYLIIFLITLSFTLIEIYSYSLVDDYKEDLKEEKKIKIKNLITIPFRDKIYRHYILFALLFNFARSLAMPYYTYYSKTVLEFDYSYIALIGSITCFIKILIANVWGDAGDKRGWRKILMFSGSMFAITNILWAFINIQTGFLYPFVIILNGIFMIGTNISIFNLNFNLSPDKDRLIYFGFNAAVVGLFAFIGPNITGMAVDMMKDVSLSLFNLDVNGYQIIFFISGVLQIIFINAFVKYLKTLRRTKDLKYT